MIKNILLVLMLILLYGCSIKTVPNEWEYKSASLFDSYAKHLLQGDDLLAKSDLKSAIKLAKQSADLEQLGRIYLGSCILVQSFGEKSDCAEYHNIKELIYSSELGAYEAMFNHQLTYDVIKSLPQKYHKFAHESLKQDYQKAFEAIITIEDTISQFIASFLIKEYLDSVQIEYLIDKASFYGYKKYALFWLNQLFIITQDKSQKDMIEQKIKIILQ